MGPCFRQLETCNSESPFLMYAEQVLPAFLITQRTYFFDPTSLSTSTLFIESIFCCMIQLLVILDIWEVQNLLGLDVVSKTVTAAFCSHQ